MKTRKNYLLLACFTAAILSCSKNEDPVSTAEPLPPTSVTPAKTYVAGYVTQLGVSVATLWIDGVKTSLTSGLTGGQAVGLYVSGDDAYVVGYGANSTNKSVVKLWKNGVDTDITDGTKAAQVTSVFVSGADVYIVGVEPVNTFNPNLKIAKLWKNGVATNLTNGSYDAFALSVYVSGSDVYVVGSEKRANGTYTAKMWKNGVATSLAASAYASEASSVFVAGSDVFVCGFEQATSAPATVGKIWKNGVAMTLTNSAEKFNSVFVNGTDVYATGFRSSTPTTAVLATWKNGVATNITDGTYSAVINGANTLYVKENDVYVAGNRDIGNPVTAVAPILWKNTAQTLLNASSSDYGVAKAVFVK